MIDFQTFITLYALIGAIISLIYAVSDHKHTIGKMVWMVTMWPIILIVGVRIEYNKRKKRT